MPNVTVMYSSKSSIPKLTATRARVDDKESAIKQHSHPTATTHNYNPLPPQQLLKEASKNKSSGMTNVAEIDARIHLTSSTQPHSISARAADGMVIVMQQQQSKKQLNMNNRAVRQCFQKGW